MEKCGKPRGYSLQLCGRSWGPAAWPVPCQTENPESFAINNHSFTVWEEPEDTRGTSTTRERFLGKGWAWPGRCTQQLSSTDAGLILATSTHLNMAWGRSRQAQRPKAGQRVCTKPFACESLGASPDAGKDWSGVHPPPVPWRRPSSGKQMQKRESWLQGRVDCCTFMVRTRSGLAQKWNKCLRWDFFQHPLWLQACLLELERSEGHGWGSSLTTPSLRTD